MNDTIQSSIRVFLLIDNRLLREALARLCRKRADLELVGEAGRCGLKPECLLESSCEVAAFDFFSPEWVYPPSSRQSPMAAAYKALLIGMEDGGEQFLEAIKAGVNGYLLKDASASDVIAAIRSTARGEAVCTPKLCATLFQWEAQTARKERGPASSARSDLTLRQRQLVNLVAQGLTNKEIANHLNLSEFTVRNHIHRIMKLVDVGTRREAVDAVQMTEGF